MTREIRSRPWPSPHGSGWSRDILDGADLAENRKSRSDPTFTDRPVSIVSNVCLLDNFHHTSGREELVTGK